MRGLLFKFDSHNLQSYVITNFCVKIKDTFRAFFTIKVRKYKKRTFYLQIQFLQIIFAKTILTKRVMKQLLFVIFFYINQYFTYAIGRKQQQCIYSSL